MPFQELSWQKRGRLWLRLFVRLALATLLILLIATIGLPVLSFCMPFVLGFIFAWLLEPLLRLIIKKTIFSRRGIAFVLIFLICTLLSGGLSFLIYKIITEVAALSNNWASIWDQLSTAFEQLSGYVNNLLAFLPPEVQEVAFGLSDQMLGWLKELGTTSILPKIPSYAIKIPSVALSFIFFLMSLYFIMADFPNVGRTFTDWMPSRMRRFLKFLERTFHAAFAGYIRAELMLSVVVFFILLLGFSFMRLPYALLLAFGLAVLDFIPIIGAGTIMVPWAIVELILGDWKTALVLMVIWGVIVLFRRLTEPRFLDKHAGLNPILSLLSIFVGMKAFGVLGMILAPTLVLVVINVCRSGVFSGLAADASLAFEDISALLRQDRPEEAEEQQPRPPIAKAVSPAEREAAEEASP